MGKTEHKVLVHAPPENVFAAITDYERYPEFLPELRRVQVVSRQEGVVLVRFEVQLIVRIDYTLRLVEDPPLQVTWTLAAAKMISRNDGRWQLTPLAGDDTEVSYELDVELAGQIPRSVSNRLMGDTLPRMLTRFAARARGLAGLDAAPA